MATALVPVDMIKKDLTCSICMDLLREPKDLDCPHTYYLNCLKQYVKKGPTIKCPTCRRITVMPLGGLTNLKSNLRLKNMIENFIKSTDLRRSKNETEVPVCQNHIGKRQHFLCVTCSVAVCHNCLVLKHPKPQHEIREWKDIMEEDDKQRGQIKQELEDVERKLKAAKDKAEQDVKARVQHVTTELKTWEMKMNQDIHVTYQKRITILQEKLNELEKTTLPKLSRSAIAGEWEIIQEDEALLQNLTVLHFKPDQRNYSSFGEVVTSSNGKNNDQTNSVTQNLVGSANRELKLTLVRQLVNFGDYDGAVHVASNQSNIIAVVHGWNISLYGEYNGEYKKQCQLRLGNKPYSVAISSQGKLFVSDGGVVKVFSSTGLYERSWPKSVDASIITITPEDIIVIGRRLRKIITLHHCNGVMIRSYCANVVDIASNGKQIAFTTGNTVCVMDFFTGHILWTLCMSNSRGICYEQKSNTLLVSRGSSGQGVVEQYCSKTFSLVSRLASDLYDPWGMVVTQDNRLVLADCNK